MVASELTEYQASSSFTPSVLEPAGPVSASIDSLQEDTDIQLAVHSKDLLAYAVVGLGPSCIPYLLTLSMQWKEH